MQDVVINNIDFGTMSQTNSLHGLTPYKIKLTMILSILFFLFLLTAVFLITIGICIGIANLMMLFIPSLTYVDVLTPSAIISTIFIISFGVIVKAFFNSMYPIDSSEYETMDQIENIIKKDNSRNKSKQNK
jgi:membrane-bound ClpP family serine protease